MKYLLPQFLEGRVSLEKYRRWLQAKAQAHVIRDRKRGHTVGVSQYKGQIHDAVQASVGLDWYTGEPLDWERISTWDNDKAKTHRSAFKAEFALLPTVDHVLAENGTFTFVICGWRTNDAKSDMPVSEFIAFCRKVIHHHDNPSTAIKESSSR